MTRPRRRRRRSCCNSWATTMDQQRLILRLNHLQNPVLFMPYFRIVPLIYSCFRVWDAFKSVHFEICTRLKSITTTLLSLYRRLFCISTVAVATAAISPEKIYAMINIKLIFGPNHFNLFCRTHTHTARQQKSPMETFVEAQRNWDNDTVVRQSFSNTGWI